MPEAGSLRCFCCPGRGRFPVAVARAGANFLWLLHWVRRRRHDLCTIIVSSNKWPLPLFQRCRWISSGLIFIHRRPNGDEHPSGRDGVVGLLVARVLLLHLLHSESSSSGLKSISSESAPKSA